MPESKSESIDAGADAERGGNIRRLRREASPVSGALQVELILETIQKLERRISERFPGSGLSRVCAQLVQLVGEAGADIERLRKPLWLPRVGAALGILGIMGIAAELLMIGLPGSLDMGSLSDFLQASEAAVNLVILLVIGIFFMLSIETRVKRRAALKDLYQLRSIIHIVDMHQLTKDPEFGPSPEMATASSPERNLTRFELVRYLDYCSELFSLSSKVAALYAQHLNDAVVLAAVNDVESVAASLSQKVWQKIMILDTRSDSIESGKSMRTEPTIR